MLGPGAESNATLQGFQEYCTRMCVHTRTHLHHTCAHIPQGTTQVQACMQLHTTDCINVHTCTPPHAYITYMSTCLHAHAHRTTQNYMHVYSSEQDQGTRNACFPLAQELSSNSLQRI